MLYFGKEYFIKNQNLMDNYENTIDVFNRLKDTKRQTYY